MNRLLKVAIIVVLIFQLSAAEDTLKVIQPPRDKLYPMLEMIANKMHEYNKINIPRLGAIFADFLQVYNTYLESHNDKPYQDYKMAIENFLSSVESYKNDSENCQLQRAAKADLRKAAKLKPADAELTTMITKLIVKYIDHSEHEQIIHDITRQIMVLVEDVIKTLNDLEKEKYSQLYVLGEEILKTTDEKEQFRAIHNFMNSMGYDKLTTTADEKNCKWDASNFEEYLRTISFKFSGMKKLKN